MASRHVSRCGTSVSGQLVQVSICRVRLKHSSRRPRSNRSTICGTRRNNSQQAFRMVSHWLNTACHGVEARRSREVVRLSSYDVVNYGACDICQSEVATAVSVSEFRVIDPQQIENRGVKVIDMHWLVD